MIWSSPLREIGCSPITWSDYRWSASLLYVLERNQVRFFSVLVWTLTHWDWWRSWHIHFIKGSWVIHCVGVRLISFHIHYRLRHLLLLLIFISVIQSPIGISKPRCLVLLSKVGRVVQGFVIFWRDHMIDVLRVSKSKVWHLTWLAIQLLWFRTHKDWRRFTHWLTWNCRRFTFFRRWLRRFAFLWNRFWWFALCRESSWSASNWLRSILAHLWSSWNHRLLSLLDFYISRFWSFLNVNRLTWVYFGSF